MRWIAIFFLLSCGVVRGDSLAPMALYLSWVGDPTETMGVFWHTDVADQRSEVTYRRVGEQAWVQQKGVSVQLPQSSVLVHGVQLEGLEADAEYEFQVWPGTPAYRFKTMPKTLAHPIRFVVGGDAYFYLNRFKKMCAQIAAQSPDFVVVGGDIAYTHGRRGIFKGKSWALERWATFFQVWKDVMVTRDGRLIPLVPVVGNHDVRAIKYNRDHRDFVFFDLFFFLTEERTYRALDFGNYLSLFLLDTGHVFHIEGAQTEWLKGAMAQRENVAYKLAAYHISAFPSVYPYDGATPKLIRENWLPLFERYHLQCAFEHHNHAYKRTYPIKNLKQDPDGVIYLGDGSWGVSPRKPRRDWYVKRVAQDNAVFLITMGAQESHVEALSLRGRVIDQVDLSPTKRQVSFNEHLLLQR